MKLTAIPSMGMIKIDGVRLTGIEFPTPKYDLVHAIQWFGTWGFVEFVVADNGYKPNNERIHSLVGYPELETLHADKLAE